MAIRGIACALALAGCALLARPGLAKSVHDSPYSYDQTFGSALRLVKVDLGLEVTESNADWGYLLFVYTHPESGKRLNRGSFSFVRGERSVQVSLQIPEMPSYHEHFIIDRLKRKLGDEHGEPPRPPAKPPPPKKDEDKDDAESGDPPAPESPSYSAAL